jgi:histidinol-phosphate aminotransferase
MGIESLARPEIVAMKPYSSARKEAPGEGVLLNANESPWPLFDETAGSSGLNRYPDPQPADLVSRLARLYGVAEDYLLVTRGSDEGIDLLTRVFCRAGQDAVLHCPPNFGMYAIAARTQGAGIVSVPRDPATFELDGQAVLDCLRSDSSIKLVFLTSPNNPTGELLDDQLLLDLLEACRDRAIIVLDEAYAEFCRQPSAARLIGGHDNLVVLRTLSKAWASAGLRCGTVLAQPVVIELLRRIITPYPLPSPVVDLARRLLGYEALHRHQQLLADVARNKKLLIQQLEGRSFLRQLFPGEANFVLLRVDDAEALIRFCAARNVIIRGFPSDPLLRDCVRISVGSKEELALLAGVLDEWESGK